MSAAKTTSQSQSRSSQDAERPYARVHDLSRDGIAQRRTLTQYFCPQPWEHFEVDSSGTVWVCCPAWLGTSIGHCADADIMEIWNSQASQRIRAAILDGSFAFCNQQECPVIQNGDLMRRDALPEGRLRRIVEEGLLVVEDPPTHFNLAYDTSPATSPAPAAERGASAIRADLPTRSAVGSRSGSW